MAGTTFKKRDLNRFRKTYPYIRRKPINSFVSEKETILEAGSLTFSAASSATHTFTEIYDSAPFVTAIAVDTDSNESSYIFDRHSVCHDSFLDTDNCINWLDSMPESNNMDDPQMTD